MRSLGRILRKVGERTVTGPQGRRRIVLFSTMAPRSALAMRLDRMLTGLTADSIPRHAGTWAVAGFLAATILYGTSAGGHMPSVGASLVEAAGQATAGAGLAISHVEISGHRHAREEDIVRALGINEKTSLLTLDLYGARERLAQVAWVESATVQKLFPDTVRIDLVEREAYALWQIGGIVSLIDKDGRTITTLNDQRFATLPLVAGYGANRAAKTLIETLRHHPRIAMRFRAAVRVAERRWNLRLDNGVEVRLPEDDMEGALAELARLDAEKDLLARDIVSIDMRLADRLIVRLSEDSAKQRREATRRAGRRT